MDKDPNQIMRDRLAKIAGIRVNAEVEARKKGSMDRLKKIISTLCDTICIGSLAKYETFFGKEWGHGLEEKDCSDEQLEKCDIWQQCRDEILNLKGRQLRKILRDLENFFEVNYKGNKKIMIAKDYEASDFRMERKNEKE